MVDIIGNEQEGCFYAAQPLKERVRCNLASANFKTAVGELSAACRAKDAGAELDGTAQPDQELVAAGVAVGAGRVASLDQKRRRPVLESPLQAGANCD